MVSSITFASWQGSNLDNNAKQFRLLADVLNDAAICVELLSPLFPAFFVALVCFASFIRAIVGVAGGSTRAAFKHHQARANNAGDISAKDGSQETLANLVALLVNLALIRMVAENQVRGSFSVPFFPLQFFLVCLQRLAFLLFALFTALHLLTNYMAMRSLEINRWNVRRAMVAIKAFIVTAQVPSVKAVNAAEPLSLWMSTGVVVVVVVADGG